MATRTFKLSELLTQPIVHVAFDHETTIYFADGGRLCGEYCEGQYGTGTWWNDTEVWYIEPGRTAKHAVEFDTCAPAGVKP